MTFPRIGWELFISLEEGRRPARLGWAIIGRGLFISLEEGHNFPFPRGRLRFFFLLHTLSWRERFLRSGLIRIVKQPSRLKDGLSFYEFTGAIKVNVE